MKKLLVLLTLWAHYYQYSCAQYNTGPRLVAMGKTQASVNDLWSIEANVAAINNIKKPTIAINYLKYSFDKELSNQGLAAVFPLKNTLLGFSAQRYGITAYNEIKTGISITKKLGDKLSIGLKGNYHQIKISNYGTTKGYSINAGLYYQLNQQFAVGIYSNNLTEQNYINQNIATQIPSGLHIGAHYKATNKVLIATTLSKLTSENIDVGLGLEYEIIGNVSLRTGLNAKPFKQYAGLGLNYKKLTMDLAFENDKNLGYTPQIALGYAF